MRIACYKLAINNIEQIINKILLKQALKCCNDLVAGAEGSKDTEPSLLVLRLTLTVTPPGPPAGAAGDACAAVELLRVQNLHPYPLMALHY